MSNFIFFQSIRVLKLLFDNSIIGRSIEYSINRLLVPIPKNNVRAAESIEQDQTEQNKSVVANSRMMVNTSIVPF